MNQMSIMVGPRWASQRAKRPRQLGAPFACPVELAGLERPLGVLDEEALGRDHVDAGAAKAARDAASGHTGDPSRLVESRVERGRVVRSIWRKVRKPCPQTRFVRDAGLDVLLAVLVSRLRGETAAERRGKPVHVSWTADDEEIHGPAVSSCFVYWQHRHAAHPPSDCFGDCAGVSVDRFVHSIASLVRSW
jgi:hypothetical protein